MSYAGAIYCSSVRLFASGYLFQDSAYSLISAVLSGFARLSLVPILGVTMQCILISVCISTTICKKLHVHTPTQTHIHTLRRNQTHILCVPGSPGASLTAAHAKMLRTLAEKSFNLKFNQVRRTSDKWREGGGGGLEP